MNAWFSCCESRDNPLNQRGGAKPPDEPSDIEPRAVCGVGINFRADKNGALFVSSLVPDGPAFRTHEVEIGDVLFEVDGRPVHRASLGHVSSHLLGPADSKVTVTFLRNDKKVHVPITRRAVPNLMTVNRVSTNGDGKNA
mmetsp:Transcript_58356/g.143155  ORF Transcript_58356/g.143155 Transcript_58356/m.143155 type:complete len:140 (+) Transcript_58356:293-712(+)